METLAIQKYITYTRKIEHNQQITIEQENTLALGQELIVSDTEQYHMKDVLDVSYRFLSSDVGFLYLHTKKGVISFYVKSTPITFIEEFKKVK